MSHSPYEPSCSIHGIYGCIRFVAELYNFPPDGIERWTYGAFFMRTVDQNDTMHLEIPRKHLILFPGVPNGRRFAPKLDEYGGWRFFRPFNNKMVSMPRFVPSVNINSRSQTSSRDENSKLLFRLASRSFDRSTAKNIIIPTLKNALYRAFYRTSIRITGWRFLPIFVTEVWTLSLFR